MSWFITVGTQDIGPEMFLHELVTILAHRQGKNQVVQPEPWLEFHNGFTPSTSNGRRGGERRCRYRYGSQSTLETVCEDMMLLGSLVRHEGFGRRFQHLPVAVCTGTNQGDQEIATSHERYTYPS